MKSRPNKKKIEEIKRQAIDDMQCFGDCPVEQKHKYDVVMNAWVLLWRKSARFRDYVLKDTVGEIVMKRHIASIIGIRPDIEL